jgi:DNA-binding winged helix-turn-helix (wHTH) protein
MADTFQIGDWVVEPELNCLSTNGSKIRVEPKIMQVLVCLVKHTHELVSKEHLIRTVWAETFVSDDVLTRSISELRRCLGTIRKIPDSSRPYQRAAPTSLDLFCVSTI